MLASRPLARLCGARGAASCAGPVQRPAFPQATASHSVSPCLVAARKPINALGARSITGSVGAVRGQTPDHFFDFRKAHIGQVLDIPYELTIDESWRTTWHSCFYQHDRLFTSKRYAKALGLAGPAMPFSMMLFLAGSMTHVEDTKEILDVGVRNAVYEAPVVSGDTLTKTYTITGLRPTSDGQRTVVRVLCELFNDANTRVFSVEKAMLYPDKLPAQNMATDPPVPPPPPSSAFLKTLVKRVHDIPPSSKLQRLTPGELILHGPLRTVGKAWNNGLSNLLRMTHPLIFNEMRYKDEELLVPWALVLATTYAASARSLFETLYEETLNCSFLHKVSPHDSLSSMSFVLDVAEVAGVLEEITIQSFGFKNTDIGVEFADYRFPGKMFGETILRNSEYETHLKSVNPSLPDRLAVVATRKLVRPLSTDNSTFLL